MVYGTADIGNVKLQLRLLATDGPNFILALLDKQNLKPPSVELSNRSSLGSSNCISKLDESMISSQDQSFVAAENESSNNVETPSSMQFRLLKAKYLLNKKELRRVKTKLE